MEKYYLGIVEDNLWIAENLKLFFEADDQVEVIVTTHNMEDFLKILPELKILNTAIIDIGLPGMSGLDGISRILNINENIDIIVLSAHEERNKIFKALCEGAVAYLSKKSKLEEIAEAITIVKNGGSYMSPQIARKVVDHFKVRKPNNSNALTPRQNEIVEALVDGLSYKLIAGKLNISVETVRDHIKKIYRKLQINSKGELIRKHLDGEI